MFADAISCAGWSSDADAFVDVFRPGVTERLGIGPDDLSEVNPRLVYARMTGYGQDGPYADRAGHDINYIALAGALHGIGTADTPVPPLNLVGDYGGGGMLLAIGLLSAMLEARQSGEGQVIDVAMVDGAATLMAPYFGMVPAGTWRDSGTPTSSTAPHTSTACTRPPTESTSPSVLSNPGSTPSCASAWASMCPTIRRPVGVGCTPRDVRRGVQRGRATSGKRAGRRGGVRGPRAEHQRSPASPTPRCARVSFVDVGGILQPAPGAPLLPDRARAADTAFAGRRSQPNVLTELGFDVDTISDLINRTCGGQADSQRKDD